MNNDVKNNVTCWSLFSTDKVPVDDKGKPTPLLGQGTNDCCEYKLEWRIVFFLFFILYFAYKSWVDREDLDIKDHSIWRLIGIGILAVWIFTNIIPDTVYYLRNFLDVEKEKSTSLTGEGYFRIFVPSVIFFIAYNYKY